MTHRNVLHLAVCIAILTSVVILAPAHEGAAAPAEPLFTTSTTLGPEFKISPLVSSNADGSRPVVVYNSKHAQYLVVWYNQWPGSRDIYAQRVDRFGQLVGPWFSVTPGANGSDPTVAYNSINDEYMVVYRFDISGDGSRYSIMGQRVNWDGNLINPPFLIVNDINLDYYSPRMVYKADYNEYLIVWGYRDPNTSVPGGIGTWLMDNTGKRRYSTIIESANYPRDPDVVWDAGFNRVLVVWTYSNPSTGFTAIMGDLRDANDNRVTASGFTNPFVIFSSAAGDALHPRVTSDGLNFLTLYEYAVTFSDHDIYGGWVSKDAKLILPFSLITSEANETMPAALTDPNKHESFALFERDVAGPRSQVWLRPFASISEIEVCNFDWWDCITPAGAWAAPGFMLVYPARNIQLGWKYFVYGRLILTDMVWVPMTKK